MELTLPQTSGAAELTFEVVPAIVSRQPLNINGKFNAVVVTYQQANRPAEQYWALYKRIDGPPKQIRVHPNQEAEIVAALQNLC